MPRSRLQHAYSPSTSSNGQKPTSSTDHREAPAGSLSSSTASSSSIMNQTTATGIDATHNRMPSASSRHLETNMKQPYDTSINTIFPETRTSKQVVSTTTAETTAAATAAPPPPQVMLTMPSQQESGLSNTTSTSAFGLTSALSSDYALRIVFEQFEKLADMKMSMVLNTGVVSFLIKRTYFLLWLLHGSLIVYVHFRKSIWI
jgi:hypothetical protein